MAMGRGQNQQMMLIKNAMGLPLATETGIKKIE